MSAVNSHQQRSAYEAVFGMKYHLEYSCTDLEMNKCVTVADRLCVCYDEHIEKVALECGDIDPRSSVVISDTHNNVKQASKKSDNDTETIRSNDVIPFWDENSDIEDDEGYNTSANNQKQEEECEVDQKIVDDFSNSVYDPSDVNMKSPKLSTQQEVSLSLSPIDDSLMTGSLGRQVLPDVYMEKCKGDDMNTQDTLTLKELSYYIWLLPS